MDEFQFGAPALLIQRKRTRSPALPGGAAITELCPSGNGSTVSFRGGQSGLGNDMLFAERTQSRMLIRDENDALHWQREFWHPDDPKSLFAWAEMTRKHFSAAKALYEVMDAKEKGHSYEADALVLPFLMVARHAVELVLKLQVLCRMEYKDRSATFVDGHKLNTIHEQAKLLFDEVPGDDQLEALERLVALFEKIDPGSTDA